MCFHVGNLGTPSVFQFREIGNLKLQSFCTLIARVFFNVRDWNSGLSTLIHLQITRYTNKNIYTKIEFENWIIFFSKDLKGQFNNSDFPSLRCLLSILHVLLSLGWIQLSPAELSTTYHVLMIITIWHSMRDPSMYQTTTGNRRLLTLVADDTDLSDRNHVTRLIDWFCILFIHVG